MYLTTDRTKKLNEFITLHSLIFTMFKPEIIKVNVLSLSEQSCNELLSSHIFIQSKGERNEEKQIKMVVTFRKYENIKVAYFMSCLFCWYFSSTLKAIHSQKLKFPFFFLDVAGNK